MRVPQILNDVIQYFSEAISRIFGLNDDAYPNIGIQPFDGELGKRSR